MSLEPIIQVFKIRDLRNKILFILGIFAVFRLMANIPIAGIDVSQLQAFFNQFQVFGLLNMFTGGAMDNFSIIMLGLGPYITATIILQLLTMIFPQLKQLYTEEGEIGRQKFNQYARLLTVPLAAVQGYGFIVLLQRQGVVGNLPFDVLLASIFTIVAGTVFLMWLGELISEKGLGNGVSLLIFAGIVADFPNNIRQSVLTYEPSQLPAYLAFFAVAFIVLMGAVLVNEARRNIPISYAKRIRGSKMYGGVATYLPLALNPAGVIPIIFALSLLIFPSTIASFLASIGGPLGDFAHSITLWLQNPWLNSVLYFLLVVIFTFFYTMVVFEPQTISSNLQKMGGFIPGIRPGRPTADYLSYLVNRILLVGALFLGLIAVMPSLVGNLTGILTFHFLIGGTSVLIIVSVVLETLRQIRAQLQMREYETF